MIFHRWGPTYMAKNCSSSSTVGPRANDGVVAMAMAEAAALVIVMMRMMRQRVILCVSVLNVFYCL